MCKKKLLKKNYNLFSCFRTHTCIWYAATRCYEVISGWGDPRRVPLRPMFEVNTCRKKRYHVAVCAYFNHWCVQILLNPAPPSPARQKSLALWRLRINTFTTNMLIFNVLLKGFLSFGVINGLIKPLAFKDFYKFKIRVHNSFAIILT